MISAEVDQFSWLRVLFAFAVVTALLGLLNYALRRFTMNGAALPKRGQARRLSIVENLAVDGRRRLVIARCDGREHLLLLGPEQDLVVQTDLPAAPITDMAAEPAAPTPTGKPSIATFLKSVKPR